MKRFLIVASVSLFCVVMFAHASNRAKQWALYSWLENGQWQFSLIHRTDHHPDNAEVKASSTNSVDAIESRISLLEAGSDVTLNPLPVLNLELHRPPYTTLKDIQRVCDNSKITWGEGE